MVAELFYYWLGLGSGLGFAVDVMQSFNDPPMLSFFKDFFVILLRKMTGGRAVAGIKLAGSLVRILLSYKNHLAILSLIILAFRLEISGVF